MSDIVNRKICGSRRRSDRSFGQKKIYSKFLSVLYLFFFSWRVCRVEHLVTCEVMLSEKKNLPEVKIRSFLPSYFIFTSCF